MKMSLTQKTESQINWYYIEDHCADNDNHRSYLVSIRYPLLFILAYLYIIRIITCMCSTVRGRKLKIGKK